MFCTLSNVQIHSVQRRHSERRGGAVTPVLMRARARPGPSAFFSFLGMAGAPTLPGPRGRLVSGRDPCSGFLPMTTGHLPHYTAHCQPTTTDDQHPVTAAPSTVNCRCCPVQGSCRPCSAPGSRRSAGSRSPVPQASLSAHGPLAVESRQCSHEAAVEQLRLDDLVSLMEWVLHHKVRVETVHPARGWVIARGRLAGCRCRNFS